MGHNFDTLNSYNVHSETPGRICTKLNGGQDRCLRQCHYTLQGSKLDQGTTLDVNAIKFWSGPPAQ